MKKIIVVVLTVLMILQLVGCQTTSDSTEEDSKAKEQSGKDQEIKLSMMHFWVQENATGETLAFMEQIDKFLQSNPNVTLEQEVLSHDNYEQKVKTLAAANELPDIFVIKGSMVDTFVENEVIGKLNADFDARDEWKAGYKDGAFGDFLRSGNIYGVPFKLDTTSLVYYNEDILAEVGYESFPNDWTSFMDAVKKLREAGYTPIALGNKGKWVAESCILSTLSDRFTGTKWFEDLRDGKGSSFEDEAFINSLQALKEIVDAEGFNPDLNSIDNEQMREMYYNKEAAMFIEGAWAVNLIVEKGPADIAASTNVAIIPAVEGGKGNPLAVSGGAGWAYQINPALTGERREAALDLLEAITGSDFAKTFIEKNGNPASNPGNYDKSKLSELKVEAEELLTGVEYTPIYDIQLSPAIIETMNSGLQELLSGIITPEELAKKIQNEVD